MTLNADGTTEGRLLGPSLGEGGQDLDVDLAGTWTLTDSIVTFDQQGDTFVRDVPFTAERNRPVKAPSWRPLSSWCCPNSIAAVHASGAL